MPALLMSWLWCLVCISTRDMSSSVGHNKHAEEARHHRFQYQSRYCGRQICKQLSENTPIIMWLCWLGEHYKPPPPVYLLFLAVPYWWVCGGFLQKLDSAAPFVVFLGKIMVLATTFLIFGSCGSVIADLMLSNLKHMWRFLIICWTILNLGWAIVDHVDKL